MSFPKYEAYKDSGVEWLGEVPEHWTLTLLKRGYQVVLGKMLQPKPKRDEDKRLPYLRASNIQPTGIDISNVRKMWFSNDERDSLRLKLGDLLISEGGDVGRPAIWNFDDEFYFQNSINRIRSLEGNSTRFLYYWIISIKNKGYIDSLCNKSTIAHFTAEKVAAVPAPFPPQNEQAQIARFLDYETARIDALIAEQQRLIELLKEKRQAVISHAVTKGLDPTVPMKDSGVEWLGEVPEHWEVCRITHYLETVVDYRGRTPQKEDSGIFLITAKNIRDGEVDYERSQEYITEKAYEEVIQRGYPQVGDVIFTTEAPLGQVANLDRRDIALAQRIIKFSGRVGVVDNYFLKYWMMGDVCQSELHSLATGSTALGIKGSKVNQLSFCKPPFSEQKYIAVILQDRCQDIDKLMQQAYEGVSLLSERRAALISAAVTGKIDVRDWQPPADS